MNLRKKYKDKQKNESSVVSFLVEVFLIFLLLVL